MSGLSIHEAVEIAGADKQISLFLLCGLTRTRLICHRAGSNNERPSARFRYDDQVSLLSYRISCTEPALIRHEHNVAPSMLIREPIAALNNFSLCGCFHICHAIMSLF